MSMSMGFTPMGYQPVPLSQREPRRPEHPFRVEAQPWHIQPVCIAPVIAGETLQNAFLQSRVITDPIKDSITGWWLEYFFFYVKLRDIQYQGNQNTFPWIETMLLDPTAQPEGAGALYETTARPWTYKGTNSIDWVYRCNIRVIECYFRLAGEAFGAGIIGSQHTVSLFEDETNFEGANWMNSLVDESAITWDTGFNVDLDTNTVITTAEIDQAMRIWRMQALSGATPLTFQEYLMQFGISIPTDDLHRPELLRFVRQWQYPSNTVNPADGTPTSAVSWSVAERTDKNRFFSEPGFIYVCSVARPKVYMANQKDAAVQMLTTSFAWLPQMFMSNPETSWKKFTSSQVGNNRGPLANLPTNSYWVDLKDLYLYGDQFINVGTTNTMPNVAMPTAALQKRYATAADADALFKNVAANKIRQDGVVNLHILGTQVETSPEMQRYSATSG